MNDEDKIQAYIQQHEKFRGLLEALRKILNLLPFEEKVKWGIPTYTYQNKNLVSLGAFKNHVALWFFQGVLLKDDAKILRNAQEGKTKAMRQIHFKLVNEIDESVLKSYLEETISNQKAGLEVERAKPGSKKIDVPAELLALFKENPSTEVHFKKLTQGRQKEYANYISEPKRERTKLDRLNKIKPLINKGVGLNDKYKNC